MKKMNIAWRGEREAGVGLIGGGAISPARSNTGESIDAGLMVPPPGRKNSGAGAGTIYRALILLAVGQTGYAQTATDQNPKERVVELDRYVVTAPVAGSFATGNTPKAILTPIEVVMVPGSAADINRALQTLPGVQAADEGNALFVRGGDSAETATWINGLRFPATAQINTPLGSVSGTISPWQAKKVDFAAGGFGADAGGVLSGAVKIDTFGAPESNEYSANLGIGGVALSVSQAWSPDAGMTATVGRDDLSAFMGLYDFKRTFDEAPRGYSYSVGGAWKYRPTGSVKWFAVGQGSELALRMRDLRGDGVYRTDSDTDFQVVSWSDRIGAWKHELNVGGGRTGNDEAFASNEWRTRLRNHQFAGRTTYDGGRYLWRAGAEGTWETTSFARVGYANRATEERFAAWSEFDTSLARKVRVIAGLRAWSSQLTDSRGLDPRLALTWQPHRRLTASVAGGRYHQVPTGWYYDERLPGWPAMRADQAIASVEWKAGAQLLRVETYAKQYRDMVALDRDQRPRGGGVGEAHGLDLMWKTTLPADTKARLTWSMVDADRTDPTTGRRAPAPWAVKHSATLILDRTFGDWTVSLAGRWASGRAITPVLGGTDGGNGGRPQPVFGAPNSERLPAFRRVDFTIVRLWEITPRLQAATYFAGFNVFGWANASGYEYSDDFTTRRPVPGVFQRSVYFGVNFSYR
jgi:hypothetical protein